MFACGRESLGTRLVIIGRLSFPKSTGPGVQIILVYLAQGYRDYWVDVRNLVTPVIASLVPRPHPAVSTTGVVSSVPSGSETATDGQISSSDANVALV